MQPLPWQREDRDVAARTLCDVAGWGVVSHTGRQPDRLQYLTLRVMDRATCNLRRYHDGTVTERMMCAESNRRDTCKVRSGAGPPEGAELRAGKAGLGGWGLQWWAGPGQIDARAGRFRPRGGTGTSVAELQVNTGEPEGLRRCTNPHGPVPCRATPEVRWYAGASPRA